MPFVATVLLSPGQVEDRIGFGKATGRHFGKFISGIMLFAGFIMVAFTQKKQGLHDIMAGCLVVNREALVSFV